MESGNEEYVQQCRCILILLNKAHISVINSQDKQCGTIVSVGHFYHNICTLLPKEVSGNMYKMHVSNRND